MKLLKLGGWFQCESFLNCLADSECYDNGLLFVACEHDFENNIDDGLGNDDHISYLFKRLSPIGISKCF